MNRRILAAGLLSCVTAAACPLEAAAHDRFVAFSLSQAEREIQREGAASKVIQTLGGITQILGFVHDPGDGDIVVVGKAGTSDPPPTLDDVVAALRARILLDQWPLVSIDPTAETPRTRTQRVRFAGGIENTRVGHDLFLADLVLKRLALGLLDGSPEGLRSYFELCVEALRKDPGSVAYDVGARFWFIVPEEGFEPTINKARGVYVARDLPIEVRMEVVRRGSAAEGHAAARDAQGDEFARRLTRAFPSMAKSYPELNRLRSLYDACALAEGIHQLVPPERLQYWLKEHVVETLPTPRDHELLTRESPEVKLAVQGGIELKVILAKLACGEAGGFRDVVLRSRPEGSPLLWSVPLEGWEGLRAERPRTPPEGESPPPALPSREIGAVMMKRPFEPAGGAGAPGVPPLPGGGGLPFAPSRMPSFPQFAARPNMPWRGSASNLGGVMLSETARVDGLDGKDVRSAGINPATGSFCFIVNGDGVDLKESDLRRFVTALWAVYFCEVQPGISIDPISPEADRQLVRFIGNIFGTDLARVLLEADYDMKKCAIGLKRLPIAGFRSVDEWIHALRMDGPGDGRRFWFVPRDMTFRRCGDAIVFDGGRMTLLSEKMLPGKTGVTDPADQAFAQFFTDHYWEFAACNSIYEELFEYARLTALASYLKESGIPLLWFLLSNRHLVLRAKVEGTVPTLRADSRVREGVRWTGGVDLRVGMSRDEPGRYVIDERAARALREAWARHRDVERTRENREDGARPAPARPRKLSIQVAEGSYTFLPARPSPEGADTEPRLTFQTDVALRVNGEPGIELVRLNGPGIGGGDFGTAWKLFLPCSVRPAGTERIRAAGVKARNPDGTIMALDLMVPRRMEVTDLLDGRRETLVFDAQGGESASWFPGDGDRSRYESLQCLTDGSCLLTERSGCMFRFDAALRLVDMIFSRSHRLGLAYEGERVVALQDGFGGTLSLAYNPEEEVCSVESPAGKVDYRYLDGDLVTVRQPSGKKLVLLYREDRSVDEVVIR